MSKTVRRVLLVALLLLLSAAGSFYIGDRQSQNEQQQFEKDQAASGFKIYDADIDRTNNWIVMGFVLFFMSIAVGIAGAMLQEHDRNER